MRADRLLAILLILQRGGRVTAGELARRLEVSERTIYRDLEALGAAGVPVYAEPGRNGGVRLVEGYRTDLSGLSVGEAELLPLLGLADVFAGLDVGPSLRSTEAKVLAALPEDQRYRAEQSRRRIYIDLSRWWDHGEAVPHLPTVVEAVFASRRLRIEYRRGGDQVVVRRTLDPFGVVVQGGAWYLVARSHKRDVRTYRVSRILSCELRNDHCVVPDDFDLPVFWAARKEEFHMTRTGYRVVARALPRAVRTLRQGHHAETLVVHDEDGQDEWKTIEFTFETRWTAFERMLALGRHAVVLEPEELRRWIAETIEAMGRLYA
ncbi:MAG TPA: YafY family protein [Actinomycetota bacterium]|nr:YafY family protein [Actinomycetota bacterium]